ncbi:4-hydroxy-tetrahydrodipicolinate reductase [Aureitalea sp. L0-47]|uniref:4-hydroxy-tetrahydrodipicolinate reductase n=1 Tax=Aureitalea sp. L0-47 TaxID=2816962 RepID=UPI00223743D6|nr:4-hydroxy-tetrahydrodipicolinate reductase [Aureitalea sp. L0-47]MCW5520997.1 4-hydroxy-tetrahydrodipicolinate reductase [Aureitalea sp. L0-47]
MKIALLGYGKMGKTIEALVKEAGYEVVYTSDKDLERGVFKEADVAIEFSTPEAAFENIQKCLKEGIPVVSGTTGWLDKYDEVLKLCEDRNGSFIYASNFSIGVNLFFGLNEYLAKQMKQRSEYDVRISETHHTQKKDAPSGTAITLVEDILENLGYSNWFLEGTTGDGVPIKARREGDVKGIHEIEYRSEVDKISIRHEAFNRDGFARGALLAAEWLQNKKGVFSMKDVLGL